MNWNVWSHDLITMYGQHCSVGGAVLIGLSPGDEEGSKFSPGALFALGGSVL